MNVFQVAGIGLVAAVVAVILRKQHPEMGVMVGIAAGLLLLGFALTGMQQVFTVFDNVMQRFQLSGEYLGTALKVTGIALVCEFSAQICRDAGEGSIAQKIEMGGKVLMMIMAVPILFTLMDVVSTMLPAS